MGIQFRVAGQFPLVWLPEPGAEAALSLLGCLAAVGPGRGREG